jgi:hypothetical protein
MQPPLIWHVSKKKVFATGVRAECFQKSRSEMHELILSKSSILVLGIADIETYLVRSVRSRLPCSGILPSDLTNVKQKKEP